METVTKIGPGRASVLRGGGSDLRRGLLAGAAALTPFLIADIALGGQAIFVSAYPLAAFVAAAFGVRPTVVISAITLLLGVISPLWNHNAGALDYWLRIGELVAAGAFATFIAVRRVRAEELSQRLALLDEIGSTADGSLPLDETLRRAVAGIVPGAADFCMVDTIRDEVVTRVAVRVRGRADAPAIERALKERPPSTPSWLRDPGFGIPPLPYFLPRVTRGHEEILSHDQEDLGFLRSLGMRSVVIAPMIARGRLLGTLTLGVAWSGRRYGPDDLAFTKALASRLGLALDHAGLFSDLESIERRMDAVMSKIPEAVTVHDGNGILVFANDVAASWVGLASGEEVVAAGAEELRSRYELFDEDGTVQDDEDDLVATRLRAAELPFRELLRVITAFDGRERWLMVTSEAIRGPDGAILYAVTTMEDVTETKRSELGHRLLARTGELLAATTDYRATLQRVAELAVPGFADWCAVNLLSEDGLIEQVAVAHADPERREVGVRLRERHPIRIDDESRLAQVMRGGQPQRYQVTEEELGRIAVDEEHLRLLSGATMGDVVAVPIRAGERLVGVLAFVNGPRRSVFDEGDLTLAVEIGSRAGMAIENARLSEMRKEIADALQQGLMPPDLPRMTGWEVATMYKPAGELNEVGGDFYDAFEVENGWMIVVGDVVGRGARAAALTALARHTIHTACTLNGDPRQALSILNDRLRAREEQPLCSVAIVVLSNAGNGMGAEAVAVSAGHPLPLVLRGSVVEEACGPGPMLGALAEADWRLNLVVLEPGDQLVLYTDGVTDARARGEIFGEERLREHLRGAEDPAAAVARIEAGLAEFTAGPIADDAAAVAVMRSLSGKADSAAAVAERAGQAG
jgi:PAS domain S-box-containing protein